MFQETSLKGRRHRAGIQDIVPQVRAQVDTGNHHVRFALQQAVEAQVHTIGWRAVEADKAVGQGLRVQRTVERQRTAGAALVLVRGDNHALGVIRQRSIKRGETGCGYPIVVRNQNTHGLSVCPTGTRSTSSRTNTVAKHPAGRTNSSCRMSGEG
ncbi:hypothetical protein D9M73_133480 [compost metagenome]